MLNAYLFHDDKEKQQRDNVLLQLADWRTCPQQGNTFDCSLFSFAVLLHLVNQLEVTQTVFEQGHVTNLRRGLYRFLSVGYKTGARKDACNYMPRSYIYSHFPCLKSRYREDDNSADDEVEIVGVTVDDGGDGGDGGGNGNNDGRDGGSDGDPDFEAGKDDNSSCDGSGNGDGGSDGDPDFEVGKDDDGSSVEEEDRKLSPAEKRKDEMDSADIDYEDEEFEAFFPEEEGLDDLEEVAKAIEGYEQQTGCRLIVKKSKAGSYRHYVCAGHVGCPFFAKIGSRRRDGRFILKKTNLFHKGKTRPHRAKDGRRWKQRRQGKLDGAIRGVRRAKDGAPTPKDVVKAAANLDGVDAGYNEAYRALHHVHPSLAIDEEKTFELLIPYLNQFGDNNGGSMVNYEMDGNCVKRLFICPGFMDDNLEHVRPVMSLDAAHMKSRWGGTLFVASVLTALDELFPVAVAITTDNESEATWTYFLQHLHQACPTLTAEHQRTRVTHKLYSFISDRDKGLVEALQKVFPENLSTSCAVHVQRNVQTKFGKNAAKYVQEISRTFSTRKENSLLNKLQSINRRAFNYVSAIEARKWRSTQWVLDDTLPPRYGITSTNSSEATNNMLDNARNTTWLDAIDLIADKMTTRIATLRSAVWTISDTQVTPKVEQIMKKRWDYAASCRVIEIESGFSRYKVSRENEENVGTTEISHVIDSRREICTFGKWQEFGYPCLDATAYFRKFLEKDYDWILRNKICKFMLYGAEKEVLRRNINPVVVDSLSYDGTTKPPKKGRTKRRGRPKKRRLHKHSKFVDAKDSPITCHICGKNGHNQQTCHLRRGDESEGSGNVHDIT